MDELVSQIFGELTQICEQYKNEVPGRRRAWPKSVKERIHRLRELGIAAPQIVKQVPIPYATVMSWGSQSGEFLPVKILRSNPTLRVRENTNSSTITSPTVTVVTPDGFRVEGMPVTEALKWLEAKRGAEV